MNYHTDFQNKTYMSTHTHTRQYDVIPIFLLKEGLVAQGQSYCIIGESLSLYRYNTSRSLIQEMHARGVGPSRHCSLPRPS